MKKVRKKMIEIKTKKTKVSIAHSVDADDAFMFYALSSGKVQSEKYDAEHILKDIQTLNMDSNKLTYDIQAISFFAYPGIDDKYQLMSCGGSVGNGYGPLLVSKTKTNLKDLINNVKDEIIAVPGEKTTAFLLLKLLLKDFKYKVLPFDQIIDSVVHGDHSFGLIIHEGQLSYLRHGLHKIVDLGEWWLGKTNLPVPLGGNVIKRSFSDVEKKEINLMVKQSIAYALENKEKVIPEVCKYARELMNDEKLVSKFVSMYVNDFTLDYGIQGKLAIKKLYELAYGEGLISKVPVLDFVDS